jgi:hypothetical protein
LGSDGGLQSDSAQTGKKKVTVQQLDNLNRKIHARTQKRITYRWFMRIIRWKQNIKEE